MMRQMMQSSIENQMMSQMLRGATITDSKEQVETLGATITDSKEQVAQKVWEPDDDTRWEVLLIGCVLKDDHLNFKYTHYCREGGAMMELMRDLSDGDMMVP